MTKTGMVLKIENNTAMIMTHTGEFVKVSISGKIPKIGESYTGSLMVKHNYFRYLSAAVLLFITFMLGGGTYGYCSTAETIKISINPSVELKVNFFGKIIKSIPLNNDGKILLRTLKLSNKSVDDALTTLVKQAKKDNFINKDYIMTGRTISVKISSNSFYKTTKLDKFKSYVNSEKINTIINNNGKHSDKTFRKTSKKISLPNKKVSEKADKKSYSKNSTSSTGKKINSTSKSDKNIGSAAEKDKQPTQSVNTATGTAKTSSKHNTVSNNTNKSSNKNDGSTSSSTKNNSTNNGTKAKAESHNNAKTKNSDKAKSSSKPSNNNKKNKSSNDISGKSTASTDSNKSNSTDESESQNSDKTKDNGKGKGKDKP